MLFDVDAAAAMGKIPRGGSLTGRELTAVLSFVLVKPSRPRYEVGSFHLNLEISSLHIFMLWRYFKYR